MRYGPYTLPSTKARNLQSTLLSDSGMVDNVKMNIPKPCTDCTILYMNAGMEYANGTDANTDTGSWLHHIVLFNTGPGRKDAACGVGNIDPFFSNGNERELKAFANLPDKGPVDSGYLLKTTDKMTLYSELMNMDPFEKQVYITIYFEYLPQPEPTFKDTKAIWIDLNQCGKKDVTTGNLDAASRPLKNVFTETTADWTSQYDGDMVFVSGHLHDGGTNSLIYKNDKLLCDSVTSYGGSAAYIQNTTMAGMSGMAADEHISGDTSCSNMGPIVKGDKFHLSVNYDFNKHPG
jgi:hypothetical protein